jgi:hypothetical protein
MRLRCHFRTPRSTWCCASKRRAVISTWHYREDHELWDRLLAGYVAPAVVSRIRAQSPRITAEDFQAELRIAGFPQLAIGLVHLSARYASPDLFLEYQLTGRTTSAIDDLSESARAGPLASAREVLEAYRDGEHVAMPQQAYVAVAHP